MRRFFFRTGTAFPVRCAGLLLLVLAGMGLCAEAVRAQQYSFQQSVPSGADPRYDTPTDVAFSVTDSTVYVADEDVGAIFQYHLDGTRRRTLRTVYADGRTHQLEEPSALEVGPNGALYVTDRDARRVYALRDDSTQSTVMGRGGGNIGELDDVRDVTVDAGGYTYALDVDQQYIPYFDEQGRYLSWIRGGYRNFQEVRAVGTNGRNELYVLDAQGTKVTILNAHGEVVSSMGRLNQTPGVSIQEPADLAVLPGGDFLVLDREDGRITHFARDGSVIGTFGAKGNGGGGTFRDPTHLSVGHGASDQVAVLDAESGQVQLFRVPARPDTLSAPPRQFGIRGPASFPRPFIDLVRRPEGGVYYIPERSPSTVRNTASNVLIRVDEARALALGPNESLYVLDVGTNTIRQYDAKGNLIREFGRSLAQELDDPSDIATVNGYVLVSEQGRGTIRVWNYEGVYQSDLRMTRGFAEPAALAANDSSRVYVWDAERNQIVRTALGVGPTGQSSTLRLRTTDVQATEGEIVGLEVDPLDQLHVFNASTNQYEIFSWTDAPTPTLRFGRTGEGPFAFDNVAGIGFDDQRFIAHVLNDDGDAVKSVQLSVRPPAPSDSLRVRNEGDTLVVAVPPLNNPAVVGYSLLRTNGPDAPDTVATRPTPEFRVAPQRIDSLPDAARYAIVSRSPTNASAPTASFANFFGVGAHLFAQGRYDAALRAYRRASDSLALRDATVRFVAQRYVALGRSLAETYDLDEALHYLRAARSFAPGDTVGASALGFAYGQQLQKLSNEERYDSLRTVATTVMEQVATSEAVRRPLLATVDTIATQLRTRPTETARTNAVDLYEGLRAWTDTSARYSYRYADAQWALYQTKRRTGAPAFEKTLALKSARTAAETAVAQQSPGGPLYHDAHHLLLETLLAQGDYEAVVETATRELQAGATSPNRAQRTAYREALAQGYRGQEKYKLAIREYQKLVSAAPDQPRYKRALADVLVENESYARAKTLYQELRQQNREDAGLVARIGELELRRGNFSEASLQLEKALEMDPDLTGVRGLLAQAYDGASNYSKAIEAYESAVQEVRRRRDTSRTAAAGTAAANRLSTYLQSLGRLHMQVGQPDDAASVYETLTEADGANAAAWHGLGRAYMESGRVYEALDALNRAYNLKQSSQEISRDLSQARDLRDKISENRPPVEIVDTNIDELYPSLYRNYSDASALPIGTVVLANNTDVPRTNARLTVYVEGLMNEPTEQQMKSLSSYSNTTIPLRAVFTEAILDVDEQKTLQARLRLTYQQEGEPEVVEETVSFTLQSRNAIKWKDKRRLAAFISPRDPQLIPYTKAIDRLFRNRSTYGLPDNVITALQTYTVLTNQGYTYSVDPQTDFSVVSRNPEMLDYCQYPEETMQRKAGDCDDLVTLYLAMLANSGVSTAYVDIPGHVLSAFDTGLSPDDLKSSSLSREDVIVSQDEVWIPVETTLLGSESFLTAWRKGVERYRKEQKEGDLPQVISMADARTVYKPSSIRPETSSLPFPDTAKVLADYRDQTSTLYARQTEAQRTRLREQLQENPENLYVRNQLGILYARGGKAEEAIQLYEKGLEFAPTSTLLLNNYANALAQQGRHQKAIEIYKRSLDHSTDDPEVYMNLCKAQLALGRSEQAALSYEKAVQRDPSLRDAYSHLQKQL